MVLYIVNTVLLLASLAWVYMTVSKTTDIFRAEVEDLADEAETLTEFYGELDTKIRNETDDLAKEIDKLKESLKALEKKVGEIPVEQLQSVYDSEKQFQDGLNAIMSYGQQNFGLKTGERQ